jgi:hypothetical protein
MNPDAWGRHPRPIVLIGIGSNAELCTFLSPQCARQFTAWLTAGAAKQGWRNAPGRGAFVTA